MTTPSDDITTTSTSTSTTTDTPAHTATATDAARPPRAGRGGRRRLGGRGRKEAHMHDSMHFAEHGRGGGRHRARRGAVRAAILTLLDERPMHGYEIITELETRSEGRWRPSPGAVYPALEKMEDHGSVVSTEIDAKRQYALTAHGREMLAEFRRSQGEDDPAPWNQSADSGRGETRKLMSELVFQVRQVSRFGTAEQRAATEQVLADTKRQLYAILADSPRSESESESES